MFYTLMDPIDHVNLRKMPSYKLMDPIDLVNLRKMLSNMVMKTV
jgi:hypothetical protein